MTRLAVHEAGVGPPVVLLHPIGLDHTWWAEYQEALAGRYRVIAVDLPGHGGSAPIPNGAGLAELAAAVAAVLATEVGGPAHVIGASLGGMVAQHLALSAPDTVASLVLCATAGGFADAVRPGLVERGRGALTGGMAVVVESTLDRWFSPAARHAGIGERCAAMLLATSPATWAGCWAAIAGLDTMPLLPTVSAPALVITGSADTGTPSAAAAALAAALPHARLEIVPDAWHLGVFENPPPFLDAFTRFLDQVADTHL